MAPIPTPTDHTVGVVEMDDSSSWHSDTASSTRPVIIEQTSSARALSDSHSKATDDSTETQRNITTEVGEATVMTEEDGVEGDANNADSSPPFQHDQYGHVHGCSSSFAFLNFAKERLANLPTMSIKFCDYPLVSAGTLPQTLPPKAIGDTLVKTYFDFGLSTSRFIHEVTFREHYESLYTENAEGTLPQEILVLIFMVLAVGSHYSQTKSRWCGYSASIQFYEMAEQQLQKAPCPITLASLQARLLIIHYLLNHSRIHEAWSAFGVVVRHAQALGLHCRPTKIPDDTLAYEFQKRTFWVIYINDRILGSIFGRPCAIHDEDVDQEECVIVDDDDITASSCLPVQPGAFSWAAALFHYVRLARILGRILREFYSLKTKRQTLFRLYSNAMEIELAIKDWQSNLPDYLNFALLPTSALSVGLHRQVSTLKVTFAYTNLLLYRPFMVHSIGLSGKMPRDAEYEQWVKRCHDNSIEAARMITSVCRALSDRGLFSKTFWMYNYAQFAAIGTLYMYCQLWPDSNNVWDDAEKARLQFPVGVEDDLVGHRYIEILRELSHITSRRHEQDIDWESDVTDMLGADDNGLGLDMSAVDFGGPWTNLFIDQTILQNF